ncbi:MAG: carboxypeptidase regulatory-like domain-containing protein [Myxococcales bacterium]|nr:MAG: carboxypeptidase regulatory-like domain-containing protein [Myxococcales bacterium]
MPGKLLPGLLGAILFLVQSAAPAAAATLEGTVTTSTGQAVSGAMVTVFSANRMRKETVFTDAQGRYVIVVGYDGNLTVRARASSFADQTKQVTVGAEERETLDLQVGPFDTDLDRSNALSASAHLTTLPWADAEERQPFIAQCNYCHQVGNPLTRGKRTADSWKESIQKMEGYMAIVTDAQVERFSEVLAAGFDGEPIEVVQTHDASPELARAKIEEWLVGDGMSFIHDADVGEDGRLYGVDEGHDVIWILDREANEVEKVPLPDSDLPAGGLLSGAALPIGIFTGKHGPHSLAQAEDGRFWITTALSSTLMGFDPETKTFEVVEIGEGALYPHTVRIDSDGMVWFTIAISNQVGRYDPTTKDLTVLQLPHNGFWRWATDAFFPLLLKYSARTPRGNKHIELSPHKMLSGIEYGDLFSLPYGIDIHPKDGGVWYAKLWADKIGHIDPETLEITEYDTPLKGPRRPRFDPDGILWIPSFDESALLRFDPTTGEFKSYALPTLSPDEYETPYALNVHRPTGDVWLTSNMSDRILRFIPGEERFISYPSPTRVTWLRDLVFTNDGKICSSSSNLPAYAIEDGIPSFICLDPNGGEKDRASLVTPPAHPHP